MTCPVMNWPVVTCPKPMLANQPEYAGKQTGLNIMFLVSLRDVLLTERVSPRYTFSAAYSA